MQHKLNALDTVYTLRRETQMEQWERWRLAAQDKSGLARRRRQIGPSEKDKEPRMGGWIRYGWISHFFVRSGKLQNESFPNFHPEF